MVRLEVVTVCMNCACVLGVQAVKLKLHMLIGTATAFVRS